jgi:hypothetical protein
MVLYTVLKYNMVYPYNIYKYILLQYIIYIIFCAWIAIIDSQLLSFWDSRKYLEQTLIFSYHKYYSLIHIVVNIIFKYACDCDKIEAVHLDFGWEVENNMDSN